MTKKDYVLIAKAIKLAIEDNKTVAEFAESLSTNLAKDNPRFKLDTFLKACGIILNK